MERSLHFIEHLVEEDLKNGHSKSDLRFRFPPEPNGYLHIGHVKAICINFNLGERYIAPVNLRFDDTNPAKEEQQYVDAIKENIKWLGYQWDAECYASDYFDQLYSWALLLIEKNLAYVDSQSSEEIAQQKGTPTQAGTDSPFRNRSIVENKQLFEEMKAGQHPEGASANMLLRDPVMYRIMYKTHHRTADDWCIYPLYDWTHGQSDYVEQVSHSLCSLEFKPHRDLYDWFLDALSPLEKSLRPKQTEFARMNLSYTVTSKRKLASLIEEGFVSGWDDPRMPTIAGLRRRGYTPQALRNFVDAAGVAKRDNVIDMSLLEYAVREDLNQTAPRVMAVLNPIKLTISNYPEGETEQLEGEINPEQPELGTRNLPFSKHLYIEQEDFKEEANRKFFRLTLDKEVRLKNAYIIKGESVIRDASGNIVEIICTYDPKSKSGSGTEESQRKVKGTLHWASIDHAIPIKVRLYDRLFQEEAPDKDKNVDFKQHLNPNSLSTQNGFAEPSLQSAKAGERFQFQRLGYFVVDPDSSTEQMVFNKTVGLRDNWAKRA
jgi:glutaminyl-tRNA synthetase